MFELSKIIKLRIVDLKYYRNCKIEDESPSMDEWSAGYDDASVTRYDEEIGFLTKLLDMIERANLKG